MQNVEYPYALTSFLNTKVDIQTLSEEILASDITIALNSISSGATSCSIWFKAELSSDEEGLLDVVVASHTGEAKPLGDLVTIVGQNPDTKAVPVSLIGRVGSDSIRASHDMCHKETWFENSNRVVREHLLDTGDGFTWESENPWWIDTRHGRVHKEHLLLNDQGDHLYDEIIYVDNVKMDPRPPFCVDWSEGGDYYIEYYTGRVIFRESQYGKDVEATYSYSPDEEGSSVWVLEPDEGEVIEINQAEVQFSKDIVMTDDIYYEVYGYVEAFAPSLAVSGGGSIPDGTRIQLDYTLYKTLYQLMDEARGAYPLIPAVGGATSPHNFGRGMDNEFLIFPFIYGTVREIKSSLGMQLRCRQLNDIPFEGERATVTFYCTGRPEE